MTSLRIVSWNCNMGLHRKFDRLLALQPDIAVIQECASPQRDASRGWQPPCRDRDWIGFNADKGLGIFTFGDLQLRRADTFAEAFALALPVEVVGPCRLNLLGIWVADSRRLPVGATNDPLAALRHYRGFLSAAASIVAGDFNLLPQQMSRRAGRAWSDSIIELLGRVGLQDVDTVWPAGSSAETLRRTYYQQRRPGRGFVVDYIFVPQREASRLTRFDVGEPRAWLPWSDHMPLLVEFALTAESVFVREAAVPPIPSSS